MLTVDQLLTPMTADQARAMGVQALQNLGLQPQRWATGGIASSTLTVVANLFGSLSSKLANAIAQEWNPTATGGGLQLLSKYFYGFNPPQPTFAEGELVLTNTGGGIYHFDPGQASFGSSVANADGIFPVYANLEAFDLNPGSPSSPTSITIDVECQNVEGTPGNASPGFVSQILSSMRGVACTNPASIAGADALSDDALRALNIDSIAARSVFGPRGAYAYAIATAVNAVTGLPVNVNRQKISVSSHTGDVTITVASPSGPVSTTDLEGISNRIEAIARPDGVTVLPGLPGFPSAPGSATAVPYGPAIAVYCLAPIGTTAAQLQTVIETALTSWFSGPNNPIGGLTASDDDNVNFTGIFRSGVDGIIAQAVASVPGCLMLSTRYTGAGDLALSSGQVGANATAITVLPQTVS